MTMQQHYLPVTNIRHTLNIAISTVIRVLTLTHNKYALLSGIMFTSYLYGQPATTVIHQPQAEIQVIAGTEDNPQNGQNPFPAFLDGNIASAGRLGILGQQKSLHVPFNIISYTAKLIENQQAHTLADVIKNDSSVQNTRGYATFSQGFRIRGFDLYSDDIAFNGLYGIVPRQILPLEGVERVEILKGASTFLNGVASGGSGTGGSINIEPKRASASAVNTLTADYTSRQQAGISGDLSKRFAADRVGLRVNLLQREGETAIRQQKQRNTALIAALDYQGDQFISSLDSGYIQSAIHHGQVGVGISPIVKTGMLPAVPENGTNYNPDYDYYDMETHYVLWKNDFHITPEWLFYSAFATSHNNEWSRSGVPLLQDLQGNTTVSSMDVHYRSDQFSGMLGLRSKFHSGPFSQQINMGYSGIYLRKGSAYTMTKSIAGPNIYRPQVNIVPTAIVYSGGNMLSPAINNRVVNQGITLSDSFGLFNDSLLFTLGLRYQKIKIRNYDYTGVEKRNPRLAQHGLSPAYGIVWKTRSWLSFYANQLQSLQASDQAPWTAINAGTIVGIATSRQYEIGVKAETNLAGGSLAFFDMVKPLGIVGGDKIYRLAGNQRHQGAEINLFTEPVTGWRIHGSSSWIQSVMQNTNDVLREGKPAPGVAHNQWTLNTEWDLPWFDDAMVYATLLHSGRSYASDSNNIKLPPWQRLDIGAQYRMTLQQTNLVLRAAVENVTNEQYWAGIGASTAYLTQGDPRTWKLSVTMEF